MQFKSSIPDFFPLIQVLIRPVKIYVVVAVQIFLLYFESFKIILSIRSVITWASFPSNYLVLSFFCMIYCFTSAVNS